MQPDAGAARPAQVIVDLAALRTNLERLRRHAGGAAFMAVLKADAYGHGARRLGPLLEASGVSWFGVALVEEGIALRDAGVGGRVLVLGPIVDAQRDATVDHGLTPMVSSLEQLREWAAWSRDARTTLRLHLEVDTGMGRLGLMFDELAQAGALIRAHAGLRLEGIASHFADADVPQSSHNREQQRRFEQAAERLAPAAPHGVLRHLANSAALLYLPESRRDLVRVGLALYGVDPAGPPGVLEGSLPPTADGEATAGAGLEGVMRVECRVAEVRELPPGATVGYGSTWEAPRPSRVGVLPLGYADGVPWRLGNRGEVLTAGGRAPIVGRVSMDTMAIDLTGTAVRRGDPAVLLGRCGDDRISARDLAAWAGTAPYEILCRFAARLPRRYAEES